MITTSSEKSVANGFASNGITSISDQSTISESVTSSISDNPNAGEDSNNLAFKDVETLAVPLQNAKKSDEILEEDDEEEEETEIESEPDVVENGVSDKPPPIPPIPDIYIEEAKNSKSEVEMKNAENEAELEKSHENNGTIDNNLDTSDNYESCPNNESNDSAYMTPANELSLNPEHLQDSDIPLMDDADIEGVVVPIGTSTPHAVDQEADLRSPTDSEKSFLQKCNDAKLTDDEIMRIYQERNPLERLAKFNSLKRKQSSVVHDIILSRSSGSGRPRTRRTRVAVPSSSIPPVPTSTASIEALGGSLAAPSEGVMTSHHHVTPVRPRASTEPPPTLPTSLPATPLTDPAKFGIPPSRPSRNTTKKPETLDLNTTTGGSPGKKAEMASAERLDVSDESPSSSQSKSAAKKDKKSLMQTISGIFRGTSNTRMASPENDSLTSPSSTSERKSRSDSFMKFLSKTKKSPVSSPEAPRANLSEISDVDSNSQPHPTQASNPQFQVIGSLIFKPSHPSTPPVPLSRKITITRHASEESLSDLDENGSGGGSGGDHNTSGESSLNIINGGQVPPEIMEKIMKRGGSKTHKRAAKVAHLKRVRKAQEIQRQLEELDVVHRDLEERGIEAEKSIRDDHNEDPDLLQTWFVLLAEKNALVRHEQELLVQAKHLELEDKSARLEAELRDHLLLDSRSAESVSREGSILQELLSIAEQRELLQNMLERDQRRYQKEDQDIEAQMKAKGLQVTPIRKLSFARLTTSSTA